MQADLNTVYKWSFEWKMPFNVDKCEFMSFTCSGTSDPKYTLRTKQLVKVNATKYLGVHLQENLQFDTHITEKISS